MKKKYILLFFCFIYFNLSHSQEWNFTDTSILVNKVKSNIVDQFKPLEIRFKIKYLDLITNKYTININSDSNYRSFFDSTVIDCHAIIVSPSGKIYRVPGFFDNLPDNYQITCNQYLNGDNNYFEGQENSDFYVKDERWKIRFTSSEFGNYSFSVFLRFKGVQKYYNGTFFSNPTQNAGFIRLNENNGRYFKQENKQGNFYPIGTNNAWSNGYADGQPLKYGGICYWKNTIDRLSNSGGNFYRIWLNMEPDYIPFQPSDLTIYGYNNWKSNISNMCNYFDYRHQYNLENAKRIDNLIEYAATKNVYIQFAIFIPNFNQYNWEPTFGKKLENFTIWHDSNGVKKDSAYRIPKCHSNPIMSIHNNGVGEIHNPFNWYKNDGLLNQKYLVKYLISRYSYATNIISWEIGNEIDNTIGDSNTAFFNFGNPNYFPNIKTKDLSEHHKRISLDSHLSQVNRWCKKIKTWINYYDPYKHIVISGQRISLDPYLNPGPYNNGTKHISEYGKNSLKNSDFNFAHIYIKCPGADVDTSDLIEFGKSDMSNVFFDYLNDFQSLTISQHRPTWIQEFDWGYELGCQLLPDASYKDPFGFFNHSAYWSSMLTGHSALPLIFSFNVFKRNDLFRQFKGISNFYNNQLINLSTNNISYKTENAFFRVFGMEDNGKFFGWVQNKDYQLHRLLAYNSNYLLNLDSINKPKIKTNKFIFEVPKIGNYRVKWFSTLDGNIYSEDTLASKRVLSVSNFIELSIPDKLLNSIYSDAVFLIEEICYNSRINIKLITKNMNLINDQIIQHSDLNNPIILNYAENITMDLTNLKSKNKIIFQFCKFRNDTLTTDCFFNVVDNIDLKQNVEITNLFANSNAINGLPNNNKYFEFDSFADLKYLCKLIFSDDNSNCGDNDSIAFFIKYSSCTAIPRLKLNGSDDYSSTSNALNLRYSEDFLIDGTNSEGETQFRISVIEVDTFAQYLSEIEPSISFQGHCDSVYSFNSIYREMINKYSGDYLKSDTIASRFYKIKLVAMNAYSDVGCTYWNEINKFIKISNCHTSNTMRINGLLIDTFNYNSPLKLNFGESFEIDCRESLGETQCRFSIIEIDSVGNYLWNYEPYITISGNIKIKYDFNDIYKMMINKPIGNFLPSDSVQSKYYKFKFVTMNAYSDNGCDNWNERNLFIELKTCKSESNFTINGKNNSTFNNPILLDLSRDFWINPIGSIGETQYRLSIVPLDTNGNIVLNEAGWGSEPYKTFVGNCKDSLRFSELLSLFNFSPKLDMYFIKKYNYFKIKLVTMNGYDDNGCTFWDEKNEYIRFFTNHDTSSFEINHSLGFCNEIYNECASIVLSNFKLPTCSKYDLIIEKLDNCNSSCRNCMPNSDNYLGVNDLKYQDFEFLGFKISRNWNQLNNIDLRHYFEQFYSSNINGYYNIKLVPIDSNNNVLKNKIFSRRINLINNACKIKINSDQNEIKIISEIYDFAVNLNKTTLKIYPNPNWGEVKVIRDDLICDLPLKYFLYDITGSLIEVGNISNGRITIGVKPGLYILQIEDKDELFKFKIIKY